ncbi:Cyclin N-terminal domain-containing protein [Heracleum sosnowskyi]|uniref:Cyclin N-terminal domain-containing protein n=1 Tax=Heracleum sosnowskyi TaxID=360622 RepID=A0AAD8I2T5_9APIA|nr:Cyclin N-terminal domain-containing protein [Heracleum sosnowskyi]
MDSLFCNEEHVWLMMSPAAAVPDQTHTSFNTCINNVTSFYTTKQDLEEAFELYREKEQMYMPQLGYVDLLDSDCFISSCRRKAIHWLIQTRRRLNLSPETVSNAVNYLDRFISLNKCHCWKYWTVALLSVACVSIASKFGETSPPALHDIQGEGLDYTFHPKLIQEMELKLLQTIQWRLNCKTPYSYVELMIRDIDFLMKPLLVDDLLTRLTDFLLFALCLDHKLLEFRPSVISLCVLRCIPEKLISSTYYSVLTHFVNLIPQDQLENLLECHKVVDNRLADDLYDILSSDKPYGSSSPVTVLNMAPLVERCDLQVDESLCLFKMPCRKRKRIDLHE